MIVEMINIYKGDTKSGVTGYEMAMQDEDYNLIKCYFYVRPNHEEFVEKTFRRMIFTKIQKKEKEKEDVIRVDNPIHADARVPASDGQGVA